MKYPTDNSMGKIGVSKVRLIVEKANCIFHKIDTENDIGNDAFIEFIDNEESRSFCIAAQIKSGSSYLRKSTGVPFIKADKSHFTYWYNLNLPVVGFVYNPEKDLVFWVDIKEYIEDNPGIIENGPYNINLSLINEFSNLSFMEFYNHYISYYENMSSSLSYDKAISDLVLSNKRELKIVGIKNLHYYHRNNILSWFILINSFKYIDSDDLQKYLVSIIQYIPGHGDIFWHKNNIFDEDVRAQAENILSKSWTENEVRCLLSLIEEDVGIQRGSIGQAVQSIMDLINNKTIYLRKIAFDRNSNEKDSFYAFFLYIYYEQSHDNSNKLVEVLYEYMKEFRRSSYIELVSALLELVNNNEPVLMY